MKSAGVYKIENSVSGKIYIGGSTNVKSRWDSHIRALNSNCHTNAGLQSDWNSVGKDNFIFSLIEESDEESVFEREKHWIEKFGAIENGYNLSTGRPREMESGRRVNLYLDQSSKEIATKLGNCNVSEGIRKALKSAEKQS